MDVGGWRVGGRSRSNFLTYTVDLEVGLTLLKHDRTATFVEGAWAGGHVSQIIHLDVFDLDVGECSYVFWGEW